MMVIYYLLFTIYYLRFTISIIAMIIAIYHLFIEGHKEPRLPMHYSRNCVQKYGKKDLGQRKMIIFLR